MIVIGLTGSIGMGKSTAANMLGRLGVPVHDADAEVHALLEPRSKARLAIAAQFPYFRYFSIYGRKNRNGIRPIDRTKLGKLVFKKPEERAKLENILHPLVRQAQDDFIRTQRGAGRKIVALDVPLLFETGADQYVDYTIAVSAPGFLQASRVLSRPHMTRNKFKQILQSQMPDAEKCARADYVLPTGLGRAHTMKTLKGIILDIRENQNLSVQPSDEDTDKNERANG